MQFYKVGEVRPPLLSDFEYFTQLVNSEDGGWKQHYNKHHTVVSSRCQNNSEIKLIRLKCVLSDVSASVLYDVIHDPKYRSDWDKIMIEGYSIGQVSPDSDIGYYSLKAPLAFANRDYVTQRAWVAAQDVYIIFNHSVFHKDIPPKKSFVRGISYITGYFIRAIDSSSCEMIYITQNDPRGQIPAWAINKAATMVAPKIMQRLHNAALKYPEWKARHEPEWRPWLITNVMLAEMPIINMHDVLNSPDFDVRERLNEMNITEEAATRSEEAATAAGN